MTIAETLTSDSLETFKMYAKDAGNWSGNPWVSTGNISPTKEQRGNISDLIKKGLIKTQNYGEGRGLFIIFTASGEALAEELGISLE